MTESFDLERFVTAQDRSGTYAAALGELRAGRKRTHWMWFVFPQLEGLGRSGMADHYALSGLGEARAYLEHPVLGPRLLDCVDALLGLVDTDPVVVLGHIDAMKLRSSMTLFAHAADPEVRGRFVAVLNRFYAGSEDPLTVARL